MLAEVEADRVSTIIVKDLSRFSRNSAMAGMFINFTFAEHGVRFISINDNFDTIDPNSIDNDFAGMMKSESVSLTACFSKSMRTTPTVS